ncbi:hypothetical protein ACLOJK_026881 [Asimina triloba]
MCVVDYKLPAHVCVLLVIAQLCFAAWRSEEESHQFDDYCCHPFKTDEAADMKEKPPCLLDFRSEPGGFAASGCCPWAAIRTVGHCSSGQI